MFPDFDHKILHIMSQLEALGTIHLLEQFAVFIILMPVPGNIGALLSEFFSGVFRDRAPDADEHVIYPARRTVQDTSVRAFPVNNTLPFFYRRLHNPDFVHEDLPVSFELNPYFFQ